MKCYNCKKEVPEDIQYCPGCGYPQQFSQDLIDRAINKDSTAEDQLYYMTYNNVFWEIRSMIKDEDTIHDLTQDTYIRAYRSLSQLKEPAAFRGWIKRIAHNLAIDYLRKRKPRVFSDMVVSSDTDEMIDFADERLDRMPEAVMDQQETKRLIDEILNSLSDEQRVAVSMHYYQQKSIKEISEELGISENTIKSRLFLGRNKIEIEVKELEKKGTKLYSLAPIPFLLFLFRTVDAGAAELPDAEILQKVKEHYNSGKAGTEELQSETVSTEGNAYSDQPTDLSSIGTEATKAAIKTASKKGIAIKILAGIVVASVIGGAIAGLTHNKNEEAPIAVEAPPLPEDMNDNMPEIVEVPEEPAEPEEAEEPEMEQEQPDEIPWTYKTDPNFAEETQKFWGSYENTENDYRAVVIEMNDEGELEVNYSHAYVDATYGVFGNQLGIGDRVCVTLNEDGTLTVIDHGDDVLPSDVCVTYTRQDDEVVQERLWEQWERRYEATH